MTHKISSRKSFLALFIVMLVALLSLSSLAGAAVGSGKSSEKPRVASPARPAAGPKEVPGELIVTFKYGVSKTEAAGTVAAKGGKQQASMRGGLVRLVKVDPKRREQARRQLLADPNVARVETNHVVRAAAFPQDAPPNDPNYSPYQWNFPQIGVPEAWKSANGAGVTVAVIDTGVAYENYGPYIRMPDLAGTSFAPGYDFVNSDFHPNDDDGHGTHVTGTIAQTTNNSVGEAGIAYGATIMPIKVLNTDGGTDFDVAQGIRFAADNGADIINLSLGSPSYSQTEKDAVDYAVGKNVLIVAAAGNDGNATPFYPAAYPGVISVGAVRYDRARSDYSNFGSWLDIVAPGGDTSVDQNIDGFPDGIVQQTFNGPDYSVYPHTPANPLDIGNFFFEGTSMASPHVAGVAALIMSSGKRDIGTVTQILQSTAEDLGSAGRDDHYGWGEVSAAAAVATSVPLVTWQGTNPASPNGTNGWYKSPTKVKLFRSRPGTTYYYWDSNPTLIVPVTAQAATVVVPDGIDTLHYYSVDSSGTTETPLPAPVTIKVDTHAPSTPSKFTAPMYSTNVSKNGSFPLSWTASSDGSGSGIASYEIWMWDRNTSATGYKLWKAVPTGTAATTFDGRAGHAYWFKVRAKDNAGNYGAWSSYRRTMVPYDNTSLSASSGFGGSVTNLATGYYMGTLRYSRRAGDWVSFTATTKRLTLIATGGNRSNVKVYIDGRYIRTVDPSLSSGGYHKALYSYAWPSVGRHTIKVVNLATAGRAQFDVDGFAAER